MFSDEEERFRAFVASMPAEYRGAFDVEATRAHEAIVQRRGDRSTHVEIWRELADRVSAICVVADDKPGLLSRLSAALVAENIDVVSAHAYCRTRPDGVVEAIDFLWIRRVPSAKGKVGPIRASDIATLGAAVDRAVTGDVGPVVVPAAPLAPGASARVRFETDESDGTTIITVEAVDRPGLLLAITQALFRANLQIVGLRATTEKGCAIDRFRVTDVGGVPLRRERLFTLQIAILGALEETTATTSAQKSVG